MRRVVVGRGDVRIEREVLVEAIEIAERKEGVIFREFKTVTGSIVTFGVEVENRVYLRKICEKIFVGLFNKIT